MTILLDGGMLITVGLTQPPGSGIGKPDICQNSDTWWFLMTNQEDELNAAQSTSSRASALKWSNASPIWGLER